MPPLVGHGTAFRLAGAFTHRKGEWDDSAADDGGQQDIGTRTLGRPIISEKIIS